MISVVAGWIMFRVTLKRGLDFIHELFINTHIIPFEK
jgi:hypothetical protein